MTHRTEQPAAGRDDDEPSRSPGSSVALARRVVTSTIDPVRVRAMRLRRRLRGDATAQRVALLSRLRQRHDEHGMREYRETRIEQSFNEQLFAQVFGYQTLFSHDRVPFHLLPKNYYGSNRYDDFCLGYFGIAAPRMVASVELKSPSVPLDQPQTGGSYAGVTPVAQAFRAVEREPGCQWVLVCNFRDLWLYAANSPANPIARADLHAVRTRDDLALLQAHFDRAALLGEPPSEAEMTIAQDLTHPSAPVPPAPGHARVTVRYLMELEQRFPLFNLEPAVRGACERAGFSPVRDYHMEDPLDIRMRDGWIWVDRSAHRAHGTGRFACSRGAEVFLSVQLRLSTHRVSGKDVPVISASDVCDVLTEFVALAAHLRSAIFHSETKPGHVTVDVDGIEGAELLEHGLAVDRGPVGGDSPGAEVSAGEFPWSLDTASAPQVVANCLRELAIQFRSVGGGVQLDESKIRDVVARGLKQCGSPP